MFGNRTGDSRRSRTAPCALSVPWGNLLRASLLPLLLTGALLTGSLRASRADAFQDKSDHFLQQHVPSLPAGAPVSAIVQINDGFPAGEQAQFNALGASIYQWLPLIHAVAVQVPAGRLAQLANLPFVSHLSEDVVVRKHDQFTVGSSGASTAWVSPYNLNGNGLTVAVVDSGYRSHPDIPSGGPGSRVLTSVSFVNDGYGADDPCGHGTHVAGIIAGGGNASSGPGSIQTFYGIARKASIVNVRVLDQNGQSTVSTVISGIQWVVNNKAQYNIRVLNLSLGHPVGESYTLDPLCQAVEQAWQAGIVVVCAAGNNGRLNTVQTTGLDNEGWGTNYGSITVPGNDPYVITVGAMKSLDGSRPDDTVTTYSSRGPTLGDLVLKPDIVAPGNKVISLRSISSTLDATYGSANLVPLSAYKSSWGPADQSQYFTLSGTSMSAPVVSGAVALMLQANSKLSPDTVKARLMVSADKWGFSSGLYDPCSFGAGYLDIPAALNCTVTATQSALSPTLVSDGLGNIYLNTVLWGTNIIWGTAINNLNIIWGSNIIWGNNILWGSNITWGTNVTWGANIIWGSNILWGSNIIWGSGSTGSDIWANNISGPGE